jgi:hypothetical protein
MQEKWAEEKQKLCEVDHASTPKISTLISSQQNSVERFNSSTATRSMAKTDCRRSRFAFDRKYHEEYSKLPTCGLLCLSVRVSTDVSTSSVGRYSVIFYGVCMGCSKSYTLGKFSSILAVLKTKVHGFASNYKTLHYL